MNDVSAIEEKLKTLQTGFLKIVNDANEVKSEAKIVVQEVEETEKKASQLLNMYKQTNETLEKNLKNSKTTSINSQNLLEKASQLSTNTTSKLKELEGKAIELIRLGVISYESRIKLL